MSGDNTRPQTAPPDPKREAQRARDAIADGRPVVSMAKVAGIMNQYASMKKIEVAASRRNIRECDSTGREMEKMHHVIAELIIAMDFKFFERMTVKQLIHASSLMEVRKFTAGETIFRKGTTGHHFYCVFLGEVDILLQEGARPIASLGPGQSFGELALINDTPRAATEAIAQAQAYACINHCIPFSEYIPAFKRRMAAVMETRNIQSDRELCPGTNLAEHLIITRKGAFEILADIELRMSETAAQLVYDESGNAVVAEGQKRLKTFTRVPIMKLDKPGLIFGIGETTEPGGAEGPGIRDWVNDARFTRLYMVARGGAGATAFVVPKKKFKALLREEVDLKRWCERYHQIRFRHQIAQIGYICQTLNRADFLQKKSFYMIKIYEEIDRQNARFYDQVEWRYYLEDIRERGLEKIKWQRMKSAAEQRAAGRKVIVYDKELQTKEEQVDTRDKTWDHI
eukprot:g1923.t1